MSNRNCVHLILPLIFLSIFLVGCCNETPRDDNARGAVLYLSLTVVLLLIIIVMMLLWYFRQRVRVRRLLTAKDVQLQAEKEKQDALYRRLMDMEMESATVESEAVEPVSEKPLLIDDSVFFKKFLSVIHENYANADLNTTDIATHFGLGPAQLTRKVKSLTNSSPVELLKDYRLKKARELLVSTDANISEIAYEVGFSSPPYLSKCFRETYGVTPTELRLRMQGQKKGV